MSDTEIKTVQVHNDELKNLLCELYESENEQFETGEHETRFEDENGRDTGYTIAIQDIAKNALDRIIELERKLKEQDNWIPIDDKSQLVKYKSYTVCDNNNNVFVLRYFGGNKWRWYKDSLTIFEGLIECYQPLPKAKS